MPQKKQRSNVRRSQALRYVCQCFLVNFSRLAFLRGQGAPILSFDLGDSFDAEFRLVCFEQLEAVAFDGGTEMVRCGCQVLEGVLLESVFDGCCDGCKLVVLRTVAWFAMQGVSAQGLGEIIKYHEEYLIGEVDNECHGKTTS